jgi:hypothetical protein
VYTHIQEKRKSIMDIRRTECKEEEEEEEEEKERKGI